MKPIEQMNLAECIDTVRNTLLVLTRYEQRQLADQLHELTRWIPVSERMPTEEDADEFGKVLARDKYSGHDIKYWGAIDDKSVYTHWQRITPPESL